MCYGVPGKIVRTHGQEMARRASVDFSGQLFDVNLACVPAAEVGDWVMVHHGIARSVLSEAAAMEQIGIMKQVMALSKEGAPSTDDAMPSAT
ncbi:MAG: HypC/HybG/HupF family hydrogenase formation chaperone [Deltaproteobacteria bacterium]|nr:HypC/HybG/HupF family hydrogenase formation chaperone [Deltaproteobacteria bacterium]